MRKDKGGISFFKSPIAVDGPIKPMTTMELTLPDGTKYSEEVQVKIEDSFYATDKCDVKIGKSHCSGDLKHYDVVFAGERMQAKVSLDGTIPAWRSQSGSIFFGDKRSIILHGCLPFRKERVWQILHMRAGTCT